MSFNKRYTDFAENVPDSGARTHKMCTCWALCRALALPSCISHEWNSILNLKWDFNCARACFHLAKPWQCVLWAVSREPWRWPNASFQNFNYMHSTYLLLAHRKHNGVQWIFVKTGIFPLECKRTNVAPFQLQALSGPKHICLGKTLFYCAQWVTVPRTD